MVCACDDGLPCPHDVMRMSDVAPTPRTRRVHNSIFAEIWQLDAEDDGSDFGNLPSNGGCTEHRLEPVDAHVARRLDQPSAPLAGVISFKYGLHSTQ